MSWAADATVSIEMNSHSLWGLTGGLLSSSFICQRLEAKPHVL